MQMVYRRERGDDVTEEAIFATVYISIIAVPSVAAGVATFVWWRLTSVTLPASMLSDTEHEPRRKGSTYICGVCGETLIYREPGLGWVKAQGLAKPCGEVTT